MPKFNLNDLLSNTLQVDGCLIWTKAKSKAGYGQIWTGSGVKYVHRLVIEITNGEIPKHLEVMHSCDVRACCNPNHLSLGTRAENMRDASLKGRLLGKNHVRGEKHPSAKLSDIQIAQLRANREMGMKLKELAEIYGISVSAVSKITRMESRSA